MYNKCTVCASMYSMCLYGRAGMHVCVCRISICTVAILEHSLKDISCNLMVKYNTYNGFL